MKSLLSMHVKCCESETILINTKYLVSCMVNTGESCEDLRGTSYKDSALEPEKYNEISISLKINSKKHI